MTDKELTQVGPVDVTKKTSEILAEGEAVPEGGDARAVCWFNGTQYSMGAQVCSGGKRLLCNSYGNWQNQGNC